MNIEGMKRMRPVMEDLAAVVEILDALADKGLEDACSLRMLSRVVDNAYTAIDDLAEQMELDAMKAGAMD